MYTSDESIICFCCWKCPFIPCSHSAESIENSVDSNENISAMVLSTVLKLPQVVFISRLCHCTPSHRPMSLYFIPRRPIIVFYTIPTTLHYRIPYHTVTHLHPVHHTVSVFPSQCTPYIDPVSSDRTTYDTISYM